MGVEYPKSAIFQTDSKVLKVTLRSALESMDDNENFFLNHSLSPLPLSSPFFSPLLSHTPLAIFSLLRLSFSLFLLPVSCLEFVFLVSAPSGPTVGNGWGTEWGASYPALRARERAEVLTKAWLQSKGVGRSGGSLAQP